MLNCCNSGEFLKGSFTVMLNQRLKPFVHSLDSDVGNHLQGFSRGHRGA